MLLWRKQRWNALKTSPSTWALPWTVRWVYLSIFCPLWIGILVRWSAINRGLELVLLCLMIMIHACVFVFISVFLSGHFPSALHSTSSDTLSTDKTSSPLVLISVYWTEWEWTLPDGGDFIRTCWRRSLLYQPPTLLLHPTHLIQNLMLDRDEVCV